MTIEYVYTSYYIMLFCLHSTGESKMSSEKTQVYSFRISSAVKKELDLKAIQKNMDTSTLIRTAIDKMLTEDHEMDDEEIAAVSEASKNAFLDKGGEYCRSSVLDTLREEGIDL